MAFVSPAGRPLSPVQQLLWWSTHVEPSNVAFSVRIDGPIDHEPLTLALRDVVGRHTILHTRLGDDSEWPLAVFDPHAVATLELRETDPPSPSSSAWRRECVRRRFNLTREVPIYAQVCQTSPVLRTLQLVCHPIAFDTDSIRPFFEDLSHAYAARSRGRPARWSHPPPHYSDFVAWQNGADVPPPAHSVLPRQFFGRLPVDSRPSAFAGEVFRPTDAGGRRENLAIRLHPGLHRRLASHASRTGTNLLMCLHAGLAQALEECGLGHNVPIATTVSNRRAPRWRDVIGPLGSVVLVQAAPPKGASWNVLLECIRNAHIDAYTRSSMPFAHMLAACCDDRVNSCAHLSAVMLNVRRKSRLNLVTHLSSVSMSVASVLPFRAGCDLVFDFVEDVSPAGRCGGLEGWVNYCATCHKSERIQALVNHLYRTLAGATETRDERIARVAESAAPVQRSAASVDGPSPLDPARDPSMSIRRQASGPRPRFAWSSLFHGYQPTHDRLIHLWESMLRLDNVGIFDAFGALGGDAALFRKMRQAVTALYHEDLSVAEPTSVTIAALSDELLARVSSEQVLEIQPGRNCREPFWFLHGDFKGGGLYCRDLCNHLDPALRFLALPPWGKNGFGGSVAEMAQEKLARILDEQPDGPIYLGGFCLAGFVAYEMAARLSSMGRQVGALILVDCLHPQRALARGPTFAFDATIEGDLRADTWLAYVAAFRRYKPPRSNGKLCLVYPGKAGFERSDACSYWSSVATHIEVRATAGGHTTCLTRHVASLASVLTDCLDAGRRG